VASNFEAAPMSLSLQRELMGAPSLEWCCDVEGGGSEIASAAEAAPLGGALERSEGDEEVWVPYEVRKFLR
jgi:hypothetical protein